MRAIVIGAGAAGLCVASELGARGARVLVLEAEGQRGGASRVAAGMLAPAFEAALDPLGRGRFELFRAGRDAWPSMADGRVAIHADGALWTGPGDPAPVAAALDAEGARRELVSGAALQALAPGLRAEAAVFTPDDWRLDPAAAIDTLRSAVEAAGGEIRRARVTGVGANAVRAGRAKVEADVVIVSAGWGAAALADAAPELAALSPIKGQLIRIARPGPWRGPTVRTHAGYLTPVDGGVVVGATMEAGAVDRRITADASARFAQLAADLYPELDGAPRQAAAAVRAATPDGLSLVGRSTGGVWLAAGFRRNGWLLAPLAARITADLLAGRDPGPWAACMRPERFSPGGS